MNHDLGFRMGRLLVLCGGLLGLLSPRSIQAQDRQTRWVVVGHGVAINILTPEARRAEAALFGSAPEPEQQPQPQPQAPQNPLVDQTDGQGSASLQVEQRRHLVRSYVVPKTGRPFSLDTRYGRVQINTWNKKEIKVDAELVARSESDAGARQILDALGVQWLDYDAKTGGVAVSTQFGPALRGRAGGCRYEVNYTVWLPRTTALKIYNNFGEVTLANDVSGSTELAVEYGTLRTARLEGPRNLIRIGNGDCRIPFASRASIDASYAQLRLDTGTTVDLRNNYSDVDIGTVQDLTVHSKYGDVALGTVRNLRGSSGYSRFTIEKLDEALDMALRYCPDFVVRDMGANFRQVNLDGGFSTIRLGFAETPAFRFDVSTEQGQLLVDKNLVRVLSQENGPQTSDVLGTFGAAAPARGAGNVNIKVRYGTVRFSK
ncbi:hypothetical protein KB206_06160 [Microvirga sp. STS02]|uniref:hypothetical protein n=1 Tax=Hymenobacter negativus TaxID=2795026 RepID=UPI0018DD3A8A|nr:MULTISPECIES: hypothetical protein [Bacteria]MBH8568455.1 hypothetical protein [Hymenobacter negativus]MBR7208190.1 hypothetical protein [Microvirga sp. STS02]